MTMRQLKKIKNNETKIKCKHTTCKTYTHKLTNTHTQTHTHTHTDTQQQLAQEAVRQQKMLWECIRNVSSGPCTFNYHPALTPPKTLPTTTPSHTASLLGQGTLGAHASYGLCCCYCC